MAMIFIYQLILTLTFCFDSYSLNVKANAWDDLADRIRNKPKSILLEAMGLHEIHHRDELIHLWITPLYHALDGVIDPDLVNAIVILKYKRHRGKQKLIDLQF